MKYFLAFNILNVVIFGLYLPTSNAASFDCEKATYRVEKIICEDSTLSELDNELSIVYQETKEQLKESNRVSPDQLKFEQVNWLSRRNACYDKKCIEEEYQSQILVLKAWVMADGRPRGSAMYEGAMSRLIKERATSLTKENIEGIISELDKIDTSIINKEEITNLIQEHNRAVIKLIELTCTLGRRSYSSYNTWGSTHILQCEADQLIKHDMIVKSSYLCIKKLSDNETIDASHIGDCINSLTQPVYK